MKTWLCIVCGLVYDEAAGWPEDGIAPGTRWEDVPADWVCPDCKVGKGDFEMLEIKAPVTAVTPAPLAQRPVPAALPRQPIVIVGSGHAGYGLAAALRKSDPKVEIRVLTQDAGFLYSKPALSIGLAQGRTAAAMAGESPLAVERRLGIRVYPHCRVERIDSQARRLHTSLGEMEYGQLVLACGAQPVRPAIEGAQDAVVSVNDLAGYGRFRERLEGQRRIAILGDGLIGCEFANDLAGSGFEVSVIGMGQWPMARLLPAEAGHRLQAALSDLGVQWHLNNTLLRIDDADRGYRLSLADGRQLDADLVLSAIGLRPDLALARSAGIATGCGIQVDAQLQTSQPGIFALGDCIEIDGQVLPYLAPINQGIQALARTLLGQASAVNYPLMPVSVKTPALPVCLLAPAPGLAGAWRCTPTGDGLSAGFYDARGTLCGFVLLGHEAQARRSAWLQSCQPDQRAVA
ncbi:FAD-dependent oxidoreductase [Massilia niastensis]|uniref:FAD-dependent oxidoreductase n=1 Tax=Massilia niastensis TaxID=544911 RepID=UPI00037224B3|nr:FAD-dependent oxidoreductase [Massilia niastensis]